MTKNNIDWLSRRRKMEGVATFGLILVAAGLIAPFASSFSDTWMKIFKWVFAAGALIYTFARMIGAGDRSESLRLRRLRRLEAWAGIAFCVAGFFWFYNEQRFASILYAGPLMILKETVMFSMAGAMIQVIASWMIAWRQKKESEESGVEKRSDKRGGKRN